MSSGPTREDGPWALDLPARSYLGVPGVTVGSAGHQGPWFGSEHIRQPLGPGGCWRPLGKVLLLPHGPVRPLPLEGCWCSVFGEGREATCLLCVLDFSRSPCLGRSHSLSVILTLHPCVFFSLRLSLSVSGSRFFLRYLPLPASPLPPLYLRVCLTFRVYACLALPVCLSVSPVSLQLCYLQGFANLCVRLSV